MKWQPVINKFFPTRIDLDFGVSFPFKEISEFFLLLIVGIIVVLACVKTKPLPGR